METTYTVTYEIQNVRTGAVITSKQTTNDGLSGAYVAVAQLLDHNDETWTRILSITVTINYPQGA